ncbi:Gti1/Pac2 family-domain-containing protein [Mycena pura]|uniref:Gti1/Pac2 family-domain-containing protein n=1 Tax=Mycena pura TaxID=153505 RepID=A0AAD6VT62_9AGAR|nr:Gti1/Pac2 family-domain-containing protein [Mycena pura]
MQQATHPRLHVRNAYDAHVVFEATRRGMLSAITQRLDDQEKASLIQSGAVFVWEESYDTSGLKRWTDGRVWSQSRMREPYLFYDEKLGDESDCPDQGFQTYRFVNGVSRGGPTSSAISHKERSTKPHRGLVKQAYSAWVVEHPKSHPRKWHITAYFIYDDLPYIPTVDQDPRLCSIVVPSGLYSGTKSRHRNDEDSLSTSSYTSSSSSLGYSSPVIPSLPSTFRRAPMVPKSTLPETMDICNPLYGGRSSEDQRVVRILNKKFY